MTIVSRSGPIAVSLSAGPRHRRQEDGEMMSALMSAMLPEASVGTPSNSGLGRAPPVEPPTRRSASGGEGATSPAAGKSRRKGSCHDGGGSGGGRVGGVSTRRGRCGGGGGKCSEAAPGRAPAGGPAAGSTAAAGGSTRRRPPRPPAGWRGGCGRCGALALPRPRCSSSARKTTARLAVGVERRRGAEGRGPWSGQRARRGRRPTWEPEDLALDRPATRPLARLEDAAQDGHRRR